jgi:putative PIG3 family NAD(P)H quinone oxidoreductase
VQAIVVPKPGGPDRLAWQEVPDPAAGTGHVVVGVVATAVNRADLLQREGHYDPPPGAPPYLGLECSGRVLEVGEGVENWAVGDEVCALLAGGGYAERVDVPAGQLMPVPPGIDLVTAAALPEVACTVWSNLFMLAALQPGETVLIHGGASGIGTFAIQLAHSLGARVAVTAGSAAKLERCRELGADVLVNYRDQDFVEAVRSATDGRGADVVLDIIGAKYLARNVEVLATNGRLAIVGMQGGTRAELDLAALMTRRAALFSTTLRARPAAEKAAICRSVVENVWPEIAAQRVRPVVDRVLPLTAAHEAHRIVESGEQVGKVVLIIPD